MKTIILVLVSLFAIALLSATASYVLQPGDTLVITGPVEISLGGTPLAQPIVLVAASLTPTPTPTPTLIGTPTAQYLPFIQRNYPPPTPTVVERLTLLTVRVYNNTQSTPLNGESVMVESCLYSGSISCTAWDDAVTLTTNERDGELGMALMAIGDDRWYRVTYTRYGIYSAAQAFYVPIGKADWYCQYPPLNASKLPCEP